MIVVVVVAAVRLENYLPWPATSVRTKLNSNQFVSIESLPILAVGPGGA